MSLLPTPAPGRPFAGQDDLIRALCVIGDQLIERAFLLRALEPDTVATPGGMDRFNLLRRQAGSACDAALEHQWQQFDADSAATLEARIFIPWIHLAQLFDLDRQDQTLLLCSLLGHIDKRYVQQLQALSPQPLADGGWLRLASAALLLGEPDGEATLSRELSAEHELLRWQLLELDNSAQPGCRLHPAIGPYLLLRAAPQLRLERALDEIVAGETLEQHLAPQQLKHQFANFIAHCALAGPPGNSFLLHLQGPDPQLMRSLCAAAFTLIGMHCSELDARAVWQEYLAAHRQGAVLAARLRLLCRDALLCNQVLVLSDSALLAEHDGGEEVLRTLVHTLLDSQRHVVVINGQRELIARLVHEYSAHPAQTVLIKAAAPDAGLRRQMWQRHATQRGIALDPARIDALVNAYLFTGQQISMALDDAATRAALAGTPDAPAEQLSDACRALCQQDLLSVAQEVHSAYRLSDIVLPAATRGWLQEVLDFARNRHQLTEDWGFTAKHDNSANLCVLFHGASGTGKTMAASIIANELNLGLYRIDLANVLSKYIGETEKQLARLFEQAEAMNIVLFFDEAEGLFSKRTHTTGAHDRYANLQTGFLLQKIENYRGIVILSTNLAANMDQAFIRRFRFMIEYRFPASPERLQLWRMAFPGEVTLDPDVDFPLLAERAALSGGNINNIALRAATYAAAARQPVCMAHVLMATEREYDKLGKVFSGRDFAWNDEDEERHDADI